MIENKYNREKEVIPKLTKQEVEDIKLLADTIFMDRVFQSLPPERRTEAVSQAAVLADSLNLMDVPKDRLSDEFILNILRNDGELLSAVDKDRRTPEMYRVALENSGMALKTFPEEMITPEIAIKAVEKNCMALEFVPEAIRTKDVCRTALDNYVYSPYSENEIIHLVPFSNVCFDHLKKIESNMELYLAFGNINPKVITGEMCLYAVKADSRLKEFVPTRIMSGNNIYSFADKLEKKWPNAMELTFEQVTKLYGGETIRVKGAQLNNSVKDQMISFDKDSHKITIKPIHEKQAIRTDIKKEKKRGLRM